MKPEILITENINGWWVKELESRFSVQIEPDLWQSPDKLKALIPDCKALIVRNQTRVSPDIVAAGTRLQVIGRAGAGLDNIDVKSASEAGIVVTHTPDQNSISVAELTLGMMLALARMLPSANDHVRKGYWQRQRFIGTELFGKTLGIIGLGRIGFLTALRAHALGMKILAYDEYISPDNTFVTESHAQLVALEKLLTRADFVSCHLPLTTETKHFFSYERFCEMKSTSFFLNLARGGVVDEQGLIRALQEEKITGAALDVREQEPPDNSPLARMENVILTPHIAAFTHEAQERVVATVCQDVANVLEGGASINFVNFSRPTRQRVKVQPGKDHFTKTE